jgi:hypothetical protein
MKVKVRAVALTIKPLISELEPMDTTLTGTAWVAKETVDTMGQILYKVDSEQCDFDLYYKSESRLWKNSIYVVIGMQ